MKAEIRYSVSELFYTLQGEGLNAGRPAVFVRMRGCNLWNGRASGRDRPACAAWCDVPPLEDEVPGIAGHTSFASMNGPGGGRYLARELRDAILECGGGPGLVVFTGGEPTLQMTMPMVDLLQRGHLEIAVETNGTRIVPENVDHICVSPKAGQRLQQLHGQELKLIYPQPGLHPQDLEGRKDLKFDRWYLQPLEPLITDPDHDATWRANAEACVTYALSHPDQPWSVSTQQHKQLRIA